MSGSADSISVNEKKRKEARESQYSSEAYKDLTARLSYNLKRIRSDYGWSQEDAAHECGMSTRLIQRIEAGKSNVTLTTLARLNEGLGVTAKELFLAQTKPG